MPKFLIEVDHDGEAIACAKVVKVFLESGSHMMTHADWGCQDGVHRAWMTVEVPDRASALAILPPVMRSDARVVGLNSFTPEYIDKVLKDHQKK